MTSPFEPIEEEPKEDVKKVYTLKEMKKILIDVRNRIITQLKKYCDIKEEYYNVIALWIIGTWMHKSFGSYPYLYFNAMKGSGKSRLLNLMSHLCWNGQVMISMSEAVMFRTAAFRTLLIDEFESVGNKEKMALRELLNSAYKKGGKVERAYKRKEKERDRVEIERFDVYCPVAMANIWGMDNTLSDRCISLVLERSNNLIVTRLIEDFANEEDIKSIQTELLTLFGVGSVVSDGLGKIEQTPKHWNQYISIQTLQTPLTLQTLQTQQTPNEQMIYFFKKIQGTSLEGRPLELFMPLFIIADFCECLDETIKTAEEIIKERKSEDISESRDISLIDYLTKRMRSEDFISLISICEDMKEDEHDWITPEWVGRALKRLNVVIEKRRIRRGREVKINWNKVDERARVLIPQEEIKTEKIDVCLPK